MRDKSFAQKIVKAIQQLAAETDRTFRIMHICGTHEATISRHGLRSLLPPNIQIISRPGCPVCVCPVEDVERAIYLAQQPGVILATFGAHDSRARRRPLPCKNAVRWRTRSGGIFPAGRGPAGLSTILRRKLCFLRSDFRQQPLSWGMRLPMHPQISA